MDKYWEGPAESPDAPEYRERTSAVAPWMEYIEERLQKYPELSAKRLCDEVKKRGYAG